MANEDQFEYLESNTPQTEAFIDAQNDKLSKFLKINPQIQSDLTQNYNYERFSIYRYHHPYYYYTYNPGLLNQSILKRQHVDTKIEEVVLDPNSWSTDGTVSLTNYSISKNGNFLSYCKSASGSDWITIHCMNLKTFDQFPEFLEFCKFTSTTFTHDELGTFYQQYPKPSNTSDLGTETDVSLNPQLKYHIWGTSPESDLLIYKDPENPKYMFSTQINHSGNILFIYVSKDCEPMNLFFHISLVDYKLPKNIKINKLIDTWHAEYSYVHDHNNELILKTNFNAPEHKLIKSNLFEFAHPTDFISTYYDAKNVKYAVLQDAFIINNFLCLEWLVDVENKLTIHTINGDFIKQLKFDIPCISFAGIHAKYDSTVMIVKIFGFTAPGSMYLVQMTKDNVGEYTLLKSTNIHINLTSLRTTKEWVPSSDGALIPMFVTRDLNHKLTGNDPVYLYGYGGFNISLDPYFSMTAATFIKYCKGIYAVACIRGGGELGESWHKQGTLYNKKRGFSDFIECSGYLRNKYTKTKLFSHGGSNGGLLTAATAQISPKSFDAVISDVGVMDMLKYHTFTIGNTIY